MSIIIAFGGAKGSGKSTASSFLVKHHDYVKGSFATKLKELITNLFNLTDECYNVDKKEKVIERLGTTPRKLLQTIGTELFRNTLPSVLPELKSCHNKGIWVNLMEFDDKLMTIDDVRFPDEYDRINECKGLCIRIIRDSHSNKSNSKSHVSEQYLPLDIKITNNGSVKDLYDKVDKIVKEWVIIVEKYGRDKSIFANEKALFCNKYE